MALNKELNSKAIAKRFREFYEKEGLTQTEFGDKIGIHQNSISAAVSDNAKRNVPKIWIYKTKQAFPHLNVDWMLYGQGDMYVPVPDESKPMGLVHELEIGYTRSKDIGASEMQAIILRLLLRVEELEKWKKEVEAGGLD